VDDFWTALVVLLHVLFAILVVELCVHLRRRCRGRSGTSLEVFKTSLELLAVVALSNAILNSSALSQV
jgi:hypothetical protein